MDGRFAISMHILTLLTQADGAWLSSDYLAGSININPVLVRKEISNLRKHGLVASPCLRRLLISLRTNTGLMLILPAR